MAGILAVTAASEAVAGEGSKQSALDRIKLNIDLMLKKLTALDRIELMLQKTTTIPLPSIPPSSLHLPTSSFQPPITTTTVRSECTLSSPPQPNPTAPPLSPQPQSIYSHNHHQLHHQQQQQPPPPLPPPPPLMSSKCEQRYLNTNLFSAFSSSNMEITESDISDYGVLVPLIICGSEIQRDETLASSSSSSSTPPPSPPPPLPDPAPPYPPTTTSFLPYSSSSVPNPSDLSLFKLHNEMGEKNERVNAKALPVTGKELGPDLLEAAKIEFVESRSEIRARVMKPIQPRGSTQRVTFLNDPGRSSLPNPIRVMDRFNSIRFSPDPLISPPTLTVRPVQTVKPNPVRTQLDPGPPKPGPGPPSFKSSFSSSLHQSPDFKLHMGIHLLLGLVVNEEDNYYNNRGDNLEDSEKISFFRSIFDVH